MNRPVAILYEHPESFKALFADLERRSVSYDALDLVQHTFVGYDPFERLVDFILDRAAVG